MPLPLSDTPRTASVPPVARQGHLEHETPAISHRVARVDGEVGDHLLELGAIGIDEHRGFGADGDELDLVADQLPKQLLHVGDDLTQVDDLRLQHLATPECEQLPRQLRRLICGRKQVPDVPSGLVLLALESLERELAVAADREEEVVEVVGDTACKVSDRFEPLRVPKLVLEALPQLVLREALGHVADHRQRAGVGAVFVE
jgi:hypothetical protein